MWVGAGGVVVFVLGTNDRGGPWGGWGGRRGTNRCLPLPVLTGRRPRGAGWCVGDHLTVRQQARLAGGASRGTRVWAPLDGLLEWPRRRAR